MVWGQGWQQQPVWNSGASSRWGSVGTEGRAGREQAEEALRKQSGRDWGPERFLWGWEVKRKERERGEISGKGEVDFLSDIETVWKVGRNIYWGRCWMFRRWWASWDASYQLERRVEQCPCQHIMGGCGLERETRTHSTGAIAETSVCRRYPGVWSPHRHTHTHACTRTHTHTHTQKHMQSHSTQELMIHFLNFLGAF